MAIDQKLPVGGIAVPADAGKAEGSFGYLRHSLPKELTSPLFCFKRDLLFRKGNGALFLCSGVAKKVAISWMFIDKFELTILGIGFLVFVSDHVHPEKMSQGVGRYHEESTFNVE